MFKISNKTEHSSYKGGVVYMDECVSMCLKEELPWAIHNKWLGLLI